MGRRFPRRLRAKEAALVFRQGPAGLRRARRLPRPSRPCRRALCLQRRRQDRLEPPEPRRPRRAGHGLPAIPFLSLPRNQVSAMKGNSHESFESVVPDKMGSERSFGFTVGGILLAIALWPLHAGNALHWWALMPALPLLVMAALQPSLLAPLNKLWFKLGLLLGRVISPVV